MTYDEELVESDVPASAFTVKVDGTSVSLHSVTSPL